MNAQVRELYASTVPLIEVAGQSDFAVQRDLLDLQVRADPMGPRRLRLRLSATPPGEVREEGPILYLDGRLFDFGKEITVRMGAAGQQLQVFQGRISRIDAIFRQGEAAEVEIRAEDRLFDLATTRHTRSYEKVTAGDLVRQVAGRHGLSADVQIEGPQSDLVQQWNETDLSFLTARLAELDADLWVEGQRLCAAPRQDRRPNSLTLHVGAEIQRLHLCADLGQQRSEMVQGGYDMAQRQAVAETAGGSDISGVTAGGRSGIDLLEQAFGARATGRRLRGAVETSDEARALARAALQARARRFVTVAGLARVLPELTIGTRLRFDGVGRMFGGGGFGVTELAHAFDRRQGATTEFCAERATLDGGT